MLLVAGLLTGCSAAPSLTSQEADPTTDPTAPGFEVTRCAPEDAALMAATITGQQSAFADADFSSARSFASESFRSMVTVDEFEYLITREYGFLLDGPPITVQKCAQVDSVGEVQVSVGSSEERTLVYRLVRERGTWAIDGARVTSARPGIAA